MLCTTLSKMTIAQNKIAKTLWSKYGTLEKKALILILIFCIFVYLYFAILVNEGIAEEQTETFTAVTTLPQQEKYLINTSNCRIPDADPFNEEVKQFIIKKEYIRCTSLGLLTYIEKRNGLAILRINNSVLPDYGYFSINCCYSYIYRFNFQNKKDNEVRYSPCVAFHEEVILSHPFVKVECFNIIHKIYSNVHATVLPNETAKIERQNQYSVLLVGIDSVSKLNLKRSMPKSYSYLEDHFHSLKGYNKIGDNTFPNLMAILTGQNYDQLDISCTKKVKLNTCDIIWKTFKKLGYVTAYAEDDVEIGTFNFNRPGFNDAPTDYYYRPYSVASEELPNILRRGMTFCSGPETSGERIMNAAIDFSVSFKDNPSFGLFWMNSFSHDDINLPSAMDERVFAFLSNSRLKSALKNTIMVFLSDHGFRFGDIRYTHTGWLDERLPFVYFYIPDSFKKENKEQYENFLTNTERLTTPYDIYTTLQDVLEMGNENYVAKNSSGCPNCHSLFKNAAENRTCKSVGVAQHWCTCTGYVYVNPQNSLVVQAAQHIVDEINTILRSSEGNSKCATYGLEKVASAGMSETFLDERNETVRYLLIMLETNPKAMFEATLEAQTEVGHFKLSGDISRLSRYKDYSYCVRDSILKKYCYCEGYLDYIKSTICWMFNC